MTIRDELFENQDLKYKDFHSRLVPTINPDSIIGVRIPQLRKTAKRLARDYVDFPVRYYEEKMLKGFIIGYKKCSIEEHLDDLKAFIPFIDNWAICDCVCSTLKFTDKNREAVWDFLMRYKNGTEYEVRFLVVMLMDYYFVDEYIDMAIDVLKQIKRDEYYINMAVAWAFSIAFIKYENKIMPLFESQTLPVFVHNKAIQKTCESYRVDKETKQYIKSLKKHN